MKNLETKLKTIVESKLEEYFAITGPTLPTYTSISHLTAGPFHTMVRSISETFDKIKKHVDNKDVEIDDVDAEELLYHFLPNLEQQIQTIKVSLERRLGKTDKQKKPKPLVPPNKR